MYYNLVPLRVGINVYVHVEEMLGVVVTQVIVEMRELNETTCEVGVVLQLGLAPLHLAQRRHTRQSHVLHLLECRHIFGPDIRLHTDDVACLLGSQLLRHRLVRVDALQRQVAADSFRLVSLVERLVVVEVEIAVRCHHHVVMLFSSRDAASLSAPRHNGGTLSESALKNFVPTDGVAA